MKIFKKKWILIFLTTAILIGLCFFILRNYKIGFFAKDSTKIAWVTDIHADRFKKRDVDSGKIYPKQYKIYLPKVFDVLKSNNIDVVIATGDNTNSGDNNYAIDLAKITKEKKMDVIWVKGNHDKDEVMKTLGVSKNYYFKDYGDTRVIVLDSTEYPNGEYDYLGGISQEQLEWLRKTIKTKKEVIVAMHMPIFEQDITSINIHDLKGKFEGVGDILERYVELEKIFHENANVKMVLSGHWHVSWQKEYNGIKYYGEGALTRNGEEGAYATIDLEKKFTVEYKFAK